MQLEVGPRREIAYEKAIIVEGFNFTCGSCRILSAARLRERMDRISPDLLDCFTGWERARNGVFRVPAAPVRRLYHMTLGNSGEPGPAHELVHALGRHVKQERVFKLSPFAILGAAKGCGHCNHDGPRAGALHEDKVVGNLSIPAFRRMFGLDP